MLNQLSAEPSCHDFDATPQNYCDIFEKCIADNDDATAKNYTVESMGVRRPGQRPVSQLEADRK